MTGQVMVPETIQISAWKRFQPESSKGPALYISVKYPSTIVNCGRDTVLNDFPAFGYDEGAGSFFFLIRSFEIVDTIIPHWKLHL